MEMEVKRGRFRMSVLEDSAQVSDRSSTPAHVQIAEPQQTHHNTTEKARF